MVGRVAEGNKRGSSRGGVVLQGTCRMQGPGSKRPVALDSPVNVGVQQDLGGQLTREGTEALDPQHVSVTTTAVYYTHLTLPTI